MDAYKDVFLSESADFIQQITDGLLALEADPGEADSVEAIFRGAHSLKGMSAAMGYERIAELTHKMEGLMDTVRKGQRTADAGLVDLMLRAVDLVRALIDDECAGGGDVDAGAVVRELARMTARPGAGPGRADGGGAAVEAGQGTVTGRRVHVTVRLIEDCVLKSVRAYMVLKRLNHMGEVVDTVPSARDIEDEAFDRTFEVFLRTTASDEQVEESTLVVTDVEAVAVEEVEEAEREAARESASTQQLVRRIPKLSETQTVRISIGHLDNMVNLVGELVILRSRLDSVAADMGSRELNETLEELHGVSGELQHEVMQTRMVPVGNIFNRFPRMVRDLARDLGKDVAFELDGLDIELDRTVLDEIGDPIVHLLRNTVDHGIEAPEERAAAGKPERGRVSLSAHRERDHVRIVVSDDGRGMDSERIWEKACSTGLVDPSQRDEFGHEDVLMLTCAPGFSTAKTATKVSGRGVGMDVVKGKMGYLGGTLSIASAPGEGTEFTLTLPLTLAIIHALMLGSGRHVYALALSAVDEVFSPHDVRVESVDGAPVIVLRDGAVAPLHRLDGLLGGAAEALAPPRPHEHLVLVDSAGQKRGLVVERMLGRQEVVLKPLSKMFREVRGVGGATVLGDGRVALVLDPRTLFPAKEDTA